MPEIGSGFLFIIAIIFLIIFVSIQFTLNMILRELKGDSEISFFCEERQR